MELAGGVCHRDPGKFSGLGLCQQSRSNDWPPASCASLVSAQCTRTHAAAAPGRLDSGATCRHSHTGVSEPRRGNMPCAFALRLSKRIPGQTAHCHMARRGVCV
jgi:hypothetical protein